MKKKAIAIICTMLLVLAACAENIVPEEKMFENARESLLLAAGNRYAEAVKLMGMNITADEMKQTVEEYVEGADAVTLSHDVTVAWFSAGVWYMAVPVILPHDNMVPAFVYTLSGRDSCSAIEIISWRDVEIAYKHADRVIWNKEFKPGFIVVVD